MVPPRAGRHASRRTTDWALARELLTAAKAMGVFKGDLEAALPAIEKFIKLQHDAADANTEFQKSLNVAGDNLIKAGDRADKF